MDWELTNSTPHSARPTWTPVKTVDGKLSGRVPISRWNDGRLYVVGHVICPNGHPLDDSPVLCIGGQRIPRGCGVNDKHVEAVPLAEDGRCSECHKIWARRRALVSDPL